LVKFSKAKERTDGTKPALDIAIPTFGYQNRQELWQYMLNSIVVTDPSAVGSWRRNLLAQCGREIPTRFNKLWSDGDACAFSMIPRRSKCR